MTKISLLGKVALITGASSGIGRATSILFSNLGANLALCGRNAENLNETAEQCRQNDVQVLTLQGDVTNTDSINMFMDKTLNKFNRLDSLVNNAGRIATGTIETTKLCDLDDMMDINLRSLFQLTQLAVPHLTKTQGNVVNISSICGSKSFPGVLAYCVSKAAVDQFTKCVALELAEKKIRVNCVNPGTIVTELHKRGGLNEQAYREFLEKAKLAHPLGRPGMADEIAQTIAFLASDASSFITGVTVPVDGGRHAVSPR
ncbi:3-oxoacyl-[acyl-carrier-protein] reductase FabG-like [Clavelina lepadiformis]|uniref:Uncharacterized protein n=1 Tax=Clavelina lepadiformis TaxID=159417 RepID=A0ABP0GCZ2_CLALP